jgi:hypothetical protein
MKMKKSKIFMIGLSLVSLQVSLSAGTCVVPNYGHPPMGQKGMLPGGMPGGQPGMGGMMPPSGMSGMGQPGGMMPQGGNACVPAGDLSIV